VDPFLHETAAERLRATGQRYTEGRRRLVDVLARAARPLTLPEVLDRSEALAQSSAYRNLVVLEEAGVVERIVTRDEYARYELAEDLTGHHHHLVCDRCGSVDDFELSDRLEEDLARALRRAASRAGFAVEHHRLDLVGRCARCA
jgi:Fur family ferric uptake transcriptional regulator